MSSLCCDGQEEVWMDSTTEVAPSVCFLQHPKKTGAGDSVRRRPAPARDAGRPADGQLASANHRRYDQRTGQAQREGELRGARRYRTLDAHHFPARAQCAVATFVGNINSMGGLDGEITNLKVGRSGGHAGALPIFLRCLQANFLDWSKKKSDLELPLAQFNLADATKTKRAPTRSPSSSDLRGSLPIA